MVHVGGEARALGMEEELLVFVVILSSIDKGGINFQPSYCSFNLSFDETMRAIQVAPSPSYSVKPKFDFDKFKIFPVFPTQTSLLLSICMT